MEGHCSTGQSPQWAVVPMEEEELRTKNAVCSWAPSFTIPYPEPAELSPTLRPLIQHRLFP